MTLASAALFAIGFTVGVSVMALLIATRRSDGLAELRQRERAAKVLDGPALNGRDQ